MAGDPLLFSRSPRLSERLAQGEVLLISIHGILEIGKARTADCPLPLANRSKSRPITLRMSQKRPPHASPTSYFFRKSDSARDAAPASVLLFSRLIMGAVPAEGCTLPDCVRGRPRVGSF